MIFGIGLPSRVSPSGTRKKPTCKPCSPYSRPISVTPATPIPPIISPAQRSYWAWQPIAQPAAEVPHERAFFPSAAAGVLLSQQARQTTQRERLDDCQLPRRLA